MSLHVYYRNFSRHFIAQNSLRKVKKGLYPNQINTPCTILKQVVHFNFFPQVASFLGNNSPSTYQIYTTIRMRSYAGIFIALKEIQIILILQQHTDGILSSFGCASSDSPSIKVYGQ
jgi:hypothetical protein